MPLAHRCLASDRALVTATLALFALVAAGCTADNLGADGDPAALIAAARTGDVSAAESLLAGGTDPNARDADGRTAVTHAVYADTAATVALLVEAGADVDIQDDTSTNALLATGETGNVHVLEEVLRADPDLTLTNRFGGTALIPAAERGHVDVVRRLLDTDIDIDHVNDLGWTALLEAIILGDGGPRHTEIVRLLVTAGANVRHADGEGASPLAHARAAGYSAIATILERAGAV